MRIITSNGEFHMPEQTDMKFVLYNVLLNTTGEQSLPLTLPYDRHNLRLIGFSNRIDRRRKPLTSIDVMLMSGVYVHTCNMEINEIVHDESISVSLYMDSGSFYSKAENVQLNALPGWPTVKHPDYDNVTYSERVRYLVNLLKTEKSAPNPNANFSITQVMTETEFEWKVEKRDAQNKIIVQSEKRQLILNDYEHYKYENMVLGELTSEVHLNTLEGEYEQTQVNNSVDIAIGKGYGMTPFLRLPYVLNIVFSHFGFTFNDTGIANRIPEFPKVFLLNNVADAIYAGTLNYKQLLPDLSVKEFILKIEAAFAGKFVFNEKNKTASFLFYGDAISAWPDLDLTPYMTEPVRLSMPAFAQVSIADSEAEKDAKAESSIVQEKIVYEAPAFIEYSGLYYSDNQFEGFKKDHPEDILEPEYSWGKYYIGCVMNMPKIKTVRHLNSEVKVNGEVESEASTDEFKSVYLVSIDNSEDFVYSCTFKRYGVSTPMIAFYKTYYRTSGRMFSNNASNTIRIQHLYEDYVEFRLNSNIPIHTKLRIPLAVLNNINLNTPKLIDGQKVMISKIETSFDTENIQTVELRTVRTYHDSDIPPMQH